MNKKSKKKRFGLIISENIECLAIAIAMALILKFFIIEAYKIPSGSMQPTIMGNDQVELFDRVLVNKFLYLLDEPERWNVIVFKFPLNQSQNYIKRLIGLPGEKITIKNGDIYVDDVIARKPDNVTGSVLKQVYPSGKENELFSRSFTTTGKNRPVEDGGIAFPAAGNARMSGIRDRYLHGYDHAYGIPFPAGIGAIENHCVGDLKVAFEVTIDSDSGRVTGEITENGRVHSFFLKGRNAEGSSRIETRWTKTSHPGNTEIVWSSEEIALEEGRSYEIAFANVDDRLTIELDGEVVALHEYVTDEIERGADPNAVSFGTQGTGGTFTEVEVFRDIYYLHDDPIKGYSDYEVPEKHYFALGDNTQNSSDGRRWELACLSLKDGTELQGEFSRHEFPTALHRSQGTQLCSFIDVYGDVHTLHGRDMARDMHRRPQSFIHEKFMLGKAMAVFWPILPHFRWKFIR
jgi:signal peptidase I